MVCEFGLWIFFTVFIVKKKKLILIKMEMF